MSLDFDGKTVIVTGASSGVGEAAARQFYEAGANVVVAARSADALEHLASDLGDRAVAVATDVSKQTACEALVAGAVERFGGIDVLVNNAGYNWRGDVSGISAEAMNQVLDVNLRAPLQLTRLALPHMLRTGGGAVVNVASLAGRFPLDGEATYSASKFGLRAFSLALSEELRETPVSVSLVSPGPIETGFILDEIDHVPDMVFSQPMSTADQVAANILRCALDGKPERAMPVGSGLLAHAGYLLPGLRRLLRPVLEAKGKRVKQRYLARG